jgi:hypothetical protein
MTQGILLALIGDSLSLDAGNDSPLGQTVLATVGDM